MDIWVNLVVEQLESPKFEFVADFIGGKCIIQKDYLEDEHSRQQSGWLIHAYYSPSEFIDRPFIADICFRCGSQRREVIGVLIKNNSFFGHMRIKEKTGRLLISARIRRMLCELDLSQPSGSRQFVVQNFESHLKNGLIFYVNLAKLNQVGGDLFKKWRNVEELDLNMTTENMENCMIELLLDATAKYDDIVIIRHAVDRLILLAQRFRMHRLMRSIEEFLSDTKLMSWDEKILLALQYNMSPLYVQVTRKYLLTPWNVVCRIQRLYLANYAQKEPSDSADPYAKIHKTLLDMAMMSEENICIG